MACFTGCLVFSTIVAYAVLQRIPHHGTFLSRRPVTAWIGRFVLCGALWQLGVACGVTVAGSELAGLAPLVYVQHTKEGTP